MSQLKALVRNEANSGWLCYENPLRIIRAESLEQVVPALHEIEQCSQSGHTAIGYVSYEAASAFDPALVTHESQSPLVLFGVFESAVEHELKSEPTESLLLSTEITRAHYATQVDRIKQLLANGDSYQVNLTHRLRSDCDADAESIFAGLFQRQPSSRALFLSDETHAIASVTPELFFQLDDQRIRMEPMKGTRPRGNSEAEDLALRQQLLDSDKERAENLMITDLIRNDLGKIAVAGSVHTDELFEIIELPTLWQQVSRVSATTDASLVEIFRALFPCASVTGAPKRRTMEIIHQLEDSPRRVYTGALGVVRPNRQFNFNVAIRTLLIDRESKQAEYSVGSGIVWDSETESEWQETLMKAAVFDSDPFDPESPEFQLLETMRFIPSHGIELLDYHLQRIHQSALQLGFDCDLESIGDGIAAFSSDSERKLRLLLKSDGSFLIEDHVAPETGQAVTLKLARQAVDSDNLFLRHKTTHRSIYEEARTGRDHCDDVILFNERNELTETTISNLYLEIDGELFTPSLNSGLLGGTYRRKLIEAGEARAIVLNVSDLHRATRLFVSNGVRGLCEATLLRD